MKCQSKKIVSIFLSLCIIVSLLSVTGINANAVTTDEVMVTASGGYSYSITDDGYAMIEQYKGTDTELVIPSTINGYTVKYIDNEAFMNCKELTSINLPDSLEEIGARAFQGCEKLTSITIPDSVVTIYSGAFRGCGLTTINIPDSVNKIGAYAFQNCYLDYVILNKNVENWGSSAFEDTYIVHVPKGINSSFTSAIDYEDTYFRDIYFEGTEEEWAEIAPSDINQYPRVEVHCNHSLEKPVGLSTVVFDDFQVLLTCEKGNIQSGEVVLQEGTYQFNIKKGDIFNALKGNNIMGYNATINDNTKGSLTCNTRYKSKTKLIATGGTYSFEFNTKTNALTVKRVGDIPEVYLTGVGLQYDKCINLVLKPVNGTNLSTGSISLPGGGDGYLFKLINKGTELRGIESGYVPRLSTAEPLTLGAVGEYIPYVYTWGGVMTFTFNHETNQISAVESYHNAAAEPKDSIHIVGGEFNDFKLNLYD
ncbi:MAG: leucine-rich repeat domain-containing protein, partial [Acutalibacteraceae bacterium]|nr:leucine-rich repeat domain-containing protein [Acutalibacteraceae bacterium]